MFRKHFTSFLLTLIFWIQKTWGKLNICLFNFHKTHSVLIQCKKKLSINCNISFSVFFFFGFQIIVIAVVWLIETLQTLAIFLALIELHSSWSWACWWFYALPGNEQGPCWFSEISFQPPLFLFSSASRCCSRSKPFRISNVLIVFRVMVWYRVTKRNKNVWNSYNSIMHPS